MTKLLVVGFDGATWKIIQPNLKSLPNFKELIDKGESKKLIAPQPLFSAALWTTIFSGKTLREHGHEKFVKNGQLQRREDVKAEFIWDKLNQRCDIRVLQVPFIMPPFNFNCQYTPVGYGASSDLDELDEDTDKLCFKALEVLKEAPDILIVVFGALDKVQHFHWGEPLILGWYKKMDRILGMLKNQGEKLIILSDHGFCSRGEAKIRTLPERNSKGELLKGDHHEEAILITLGIDTPINHHKDVFKAIIEECKTN
jgi:predicted AlkP superfamily phosphohydrolase/phosphomutase